jgi:hypothetical protein
MKQWMAAVTVVVLTLGIFSGCGRKADDGSASGGDPEVPASELLRAEIADLKLSSGRDTAIERMKALIADPEQQEFKPNLVEWLLEECLMEDAVEDVQDVYLELAAGDEDVARMGFRQIMHASTSTNAATAVAWYEKVLAAPVSDDMKSHVWQLRTRAYSDAGSILPVADRLSEILALASPEQSLGVISSVARIGLSSKDYAGLAALLAAVKQDAAEREDLMHLALTVDADVLLQQGKLAAAAAFLSANADALGDKALSTRAKSLLAAAVSASDNPLAECVVSAALAAGAERPMTRDTVALSWISIAEKGQQHDAFLTRVAAALDAGCQESRVASAFGSGFYKVMMVRDPAFQTRCLELGERLAAADDLSDGQRQSLTLMQLDGAFYASDFARAYAIIESGVPGHDDVWHVEMKDKVGAHLALQEGRPEDAIGLFKKHMARVDAWEAPVVNPENGAKMTRQAVLGFNENRIGDIYAGMDGRAADASAAYARARDWYQKAIADAEPDSIESKLAADELAQIPAGE